VGEEFEVTKHIGSPDLQVFVTRPLWQRAGEGVFPILDFDLVNLGCAAAACAASGHGANLNHETRNTQALASLAVAAAWLSYDLGGLRLFMLGQFDAARRLGVANQAHLIEPRANCRIVADKEIPRGLYGRRMLLMMLRNERAFLAFE
jgi:hypothetical protein